MTSALKEARLKDDHSSGPIGQTVAKGLTIQTLQGSDPGPATRSVDNTINRSIQALKRGGGEHCFNLKDGQEKRVSRYGGKDSFAGWIWRLFVRSVWTNGQFDLQTGMQCPHLDRY